MTMLAICLAPCVCKRIHKIDQPGKVICLVRENGFRWKTITRKTLVSLVLVGKGIMPYNMT